MSSEKMDIMQGERTDNKGRCHVMLLVYVALLSTVGVALLISIGYVVFRSQDGASQQVTQDAHVSGSTRKRYDVNFHGFDDKVDIDVANSREVVYSELNGQSVIMVLEFDRSLAGIYAEHEDICLLIGGIDDRIPTPVVLQELMEKGNRTVDSEAVVEYEVAGDYPVTDHTLLPEELREPCRTKQVFWLKLATTSPDSRQKRDVEIEVCIAWGLICVSVRIGREEQ